MAIKMLPPRPGRPLVGRPMLPKPRPIRGEMREMRGMDRQGMTRRRKFGSVIGGAVNVVA